MSEPYFTAPLVTLWHANALDLPLPDASVDLIVTSPPYFGLRSYTDGGEHYAGQIGSEPTPAEFLDALIAATREMVRVLKPSGSIWVNLGDKYVSDNRGSGYSEKRKEAKWAPPGDRGFVGRDMAPRKSLLGLPWRYALRCIDELGLILRAEVIWSKPNGLPESVTDRVRRSHEQWFHFTVQPRYFAAVDEIREPQSTADRTGPRRSYPSGSASSIAANGEHVSMSGPFAGLPLNPLGKLPGSVWAVPTQPLNVPPELGIDHFAAFPMEWPRRIIKGWAPTAGVCVECGEGRRPNRGRACELCGAFIPTQGKRCAECGHVRDWKNGRVQLNEMNSLDWSTAGNGVPRHPGGHQNTGIVTGYACACPEPTAPTTPAVVLDPFGGTGTTALVASVLGCHGHSVDLSADYCRLAQWRVTDPGQRAAAAQVEAVEPVPDDQPDLFDVLDFGGGAA